MPSTVLMVRPAAFGYSSEAAATNVFQQRPEATPEEVSSTAIREFDRMVELLSEEGIQVIVAEDSVSPPKPDAVFPNNWVSWQADGPVVLYPMAVPSRRAERRAEVLAKVEAVTGPRRVVDLSGLETQGAFVEGTGSLVLDRRTRRAYAGISPRTTARGVQAACEVLGYKPVFFASELDGAPVYHSNVVLSVGPNWALWYPSFKGNLGVMRSLAGKWVLQLEAAQVREYAANVLALEGRHGPVTVASRRAAEALTADQRAVIGRMRVVDIPTIERVGGGSARCMMAEVV